MQSMTGYGKAEYSAEGVSLAVEIKTVNNRFLDVVPKYPRQFLKYDDLIRRTVSEYLTRGRVELFISLKVVESDSKNLVVDMSVAENYYRAFNDLKARFPDLSAQLSVYELMKFPSIITDAPEEDDDRFRDILSDVLIEALKNLNEMRKVEGDKLKLDLTSRITEVEKIVCEIADRAPLIKQVYKDKLKARVEEYLGGVNMDETRLLQEVALYADKTNIDEELTRLKSHIEQFRSIIETENCGKRLDFLVQELNREANTVCSKSNDVVITSCGLKLKNEIEKIREQIQNIE